MAAVPEPDLDASERVMLAMMDSREFGFLNLRQPQRLHETIIIQKALRHYEHLISEYDERVKDAAGDASADTKVDNGKDGDAAAEKHGNKLLLANVFLKLGHLHLISEDYVKALSAYQQYFELDNNSWKDATFYYGLGMVYFHFRAYSVASEAFRTVLYTQPHFKRVREVHLRLALAYKAQDEWALAIKHLRQALVDNTGHCTLTKPEIAFHIAHCEDASGNLLEAKTQYTAILNGNPPDALSATLKACIFRQLGWLYYRVESSSAEQRSADIAQAIQFLNESIQHDPACGKTYYYLGRCYSAVAGRAHDAFVNYRQSIDKAEASADTWCSIGVLYQQQQQPMDAVQAFVCAVQLDPAHTAAWTDLALLYEQYTQFHDALHCYRNALKHNPDNSEDIRLRVNVLDRELRATGLPRTRGTLPSLDDAWRLPIPSELIARQTEMLKQKQHRYAQGSAHLRVEYELGLDARTASQLPSFYMDSQRIEMMHVLERSQPQLTHDQLNTLTQLRHNYELMQQHMKLVQQQKIDNTKQAATTAADTKPAADLPYVSAEDLMDVFGNAAGADAHTGHTIAGPATIAPSAADLLLGGFGDVTRDSGDDDPMFGSAALTTKQRSNALQDTHITTSTSRVAGAAPSVIPIAVGADQKPTAANLLPPVLNLEAPLLVPININSTEVIQLCKERAAASSADAFQMIFDEHAPPPRPPAKPDVKVDAQGMLLPTPTVIVDSKKDALSPELQQYCYSHQVALIKGLTTALRIDLSYFSTKTLMEVASEVDVEVRTQLKMPSDVNTDASGVETWHCNSTKSFTTIAKYAQYQAQTFQQALREEQERMKSGVGTKEFQPFAKRACLTESGRIKTLKFGTNVDLSDEKKWPVQLGEIQKLPAFCRLHAACNTLTHLGHPVFGMNTVQLYMKVPGCRTPGHRENNNFCAININIGPGECEWFAIDDMYWGELHRMCRRHGIDFLKGSWWPSLTELAAAAIPIRRFTQKAGDMVWLGPGVIHWVHSIGWCNNIAWNVGPCSTYQLQQAIIAYEWNKLQSYKSIVPLIHLFWQLARNIRFTQQRCLHVVRGVLIRSLAYCRMQIDYVVSLGKTVKDQPRTRGEWSHYCQVCEQETFNLLYVCESSDGRYLVHCIHCALRIDARLHTFTVLQQWTMEELGGFLDACTLTSAAVGTGGTGAQKSTPQQCAAPAHNTQLVIC